MPIRYTRVGWQDAPSTETPIDAANLNHMDNGILALSEAYDVEISTVQQQFQDVLKEVSELKQLVANQVHCHVGMIIHSTTLNTEAEVIAVYGGEHWIQHTGYFLYGDNTGVTDNNAVADGGEPSHTLTVEEMPSHTHKVRYTGGNANGNNGGMPGTSVDATPGYNDLIIANEGGGQSHNNMPPYKKVYIWECVVVDSGDDPILIEEEDP